MNDDFIKHARFYGEKGKRWLETIPEIIKEYEHRWSFRALSAFENLTYNYVAPVKLFNGIAAVLKIGIPEDKEFQTEIEALKLFDGEGSAKLLEADRKRAIILIELINPGIPLSTIQDDEKSTRILASVMKKLWKPLPQNHSFITISEWTNALKEYPTRYKNNFPIPLSLVKQAEQLFEDLILTSASPVLTHADLHHDNVLTSNRDGWLAIDPKGIAAEPAYETAAMIRNPYKKLSKMKNIDELLKRRIIILSGELGFDPKRILKWCLAQTILSGVWTSEDTGDVNHAMKIIQSLKRITV